MPPNAERMTRAQVVASFVVLCYVWVFLGAVYVQNQQRTGATAADLPQTVAPATRVVSIFLGWDNRVYTEDAGEILDHVALLECPHQVIAVRVSEHGPLVTMERQPAPDMRAVYRIQVDQPYVVVSSRTGIQLLFRNSEYVWLTALCHRSNAASEEWGLYRSNDAPVGTMWRILPNDATMTRNLTYCMIQTEQGVWWVRALSGYVHC